MSFFSKSVEGKGCEPGQAKRGDLLQVVEHAIRDQLQEDPRHSDLETMEKYVNNLSICRDRGLWGCTIHYTFVQKCIDLYKQPGMPFVAGMSAGSRTSPSGRASTSVASRETSGSLSNANERLVPIHITTAEGRRRMALAHKNLEELHNYISRRIAEESGFLGGPGSVIHVTLTLVGESHVCDLHVRDMSEEMMLREDLLRRFGTYIPEYRMSDWLNTPDTSTRDSASATIPARPDLPPQTRQWDSNTRGRSGNPGPRPDGFGSSPNARQSDAGGDRDPRLHDAWMGLAAHMTRWEAG